jgi:predicted nucleic acid-binding protein
MIYLDANVFLFAFIHPKKKTLSAKTKWCKQQAKRIVEELNASDSEYPLYCISLIQLSEITNILKKHFSQRELHEILFGLYCNPNIEIVEVSYSDYLNAIEKMNEYDLDANDLSAYIIMKKKKISQIYTFDDGFRNLKDIDCLPFMPENLK